MTFRSKTVFALLSALMLAQAHAQTSPPADGTNLVSALDANVEEVNAMLRSLLNAQTNQVEAAAAPAPATENVDENQPSSDATASQKPAEVKAVSTIQTNTEAKIETNPDGAAEDADNSADLNAPTSEISDLLGLAKAGDAQAQFELGSRYAKGKGIARDETAALKWLQAAAEQNLGIAQFYLGDLLAKSSKPDYAEAFRWQRKAAEKGIAPAQSALAELYAGGRGIETNAAAATLWYARAADRGFAEAQYQMGLIHIRTADAPEDLAEAVRWFSKAAQQHHAAAEFKLGTLYYDGLGASQDYIVAMKWFRKSAAQGVGEACFNLGLMYTLGQGCTADYPEAYKWYTLAMWRGSQAAAENREAIAPKLNPEQIAAGRAAAKQFAVEKNWRMP